MTQRNRTGGIEQAFRFDGAWHVITDGGSAASRLVPPDLSLPLLLRKVRE